VIAMQPLRFTREKNEAKLANAVCEAKTSSKKIGAKRRSVKQTTTACCL